MPPKKAPAKKALAKKAAPKKPAAPKKKPLPIFAPAKKAAPKKNPAPKKKPKPPSWPSDPLAAPVPKKAAAKKKRKPAAAAAAPPGAFAIAWPHLAAALQKKPAAAKPAAWVTPAHPDVNDIDVGMQVPLATPGPEQAVPTPAQNKTLGEGVFGKVEFIKTPGGHKYANKLWKNDPDDTGNQGERIAAKLFAAKPPLYLLPVVRTASGVKLQFFPGITLEKWLRKMKASGRPENATFLGTMINTYIAAMVEASEYRLIVNDQHDENLLVNPTTGVVKPIDYGFWRLAQSKIEAYENNWDVAKRTVGWIAMAQFDQVFRKVVYRKQ